MSTPVEDFHEHSCGKPCGSTPVSAPASSFLWTWSYCFPVVWKKEILTRGTPPQVTRSLVTQLDMFVISACPFSPTSLKVTDGNLCHAQVLESWNNKWDEGHGDNLRRIDKEERKATPENGSGREPAGSEPWTL